MDEPRADPPAVDASLPAAAPPASGPEPPASGPPAPASPTWRALAERELPPRLAWLVIVGLSIGAGAVTARVQEQRQALEDCRAACAGWDGRRGASPSCDCPEAEGARALRDDRGPDPWPGRHGRSGR